MDRLYLVDRRIIPTIIIHAGPRGAPTDAATCVEQVDLK